MSAQARSTTRALDIRSEPWWTVARSDITRRGASLRAPFPEARPDPIPSLSVVQSGWSLGFAAAYTSRLDVVGEPGLPGEGEHLILAYWLWGQEKGRYVLGSPTCRPGPSGGGRLAARRAAEGCGRLKGAARSLEFPG